MRKNPRADGLKPAYLVSFGLGGHSIDIFNQYGPPGTLSGYENPETFEQRTAAGDYAEYALEGVPVVDKRALLRLKPGLAVSMPMHRADLAPGTSDAFTDRHRETALQMMLGLCGGFASLATLAQSQTFSGMDYVATDIYLELWRQAGARIGRMQSGRITWE